MTRTNVESKKLTISKRVRNSPFKIWKWLPIDQAGLMGSDDPDHTPTRALYLQIAQHISHGISNAERESAVAVFEVLVCIDLPLGSERFAELLSMDKEGTGALPDVQTLCFGLVEITDNNTIRMIDNTIANVLTEGSMPIYIQKDRAHARLFSKLLRRLMSTSAPLQTSHDQIPGLLQYAAVYWIQHLQAAEHAIDTLEVQLLQDFLASEFALTWIEILERLEVDDYDIESTLSTISYIAKATNANSPSVVRSLALSIIDLTIIWSPHHRALRHDPRAIHTSIASFLP